MFVGVCCVWVSEWVGGWVCVFVCGWVGGMRDCVCICACTCVSRCVHTHVCVFRSTYPSSGWHLRLVHLRRAVPANRTRGHRREIGGKGSRLFLTFASKHFLGESGGQYVTDG